MHLKSKASESSLNNWQSVGALALVVAGLGWACQSSLAQTAFPPPLAARTLSRIGTGSVPPKDGSLLLPSESPSPLAPLLASWEGMSSDFLLEPPDPHGAAGPNGVIQTVNVRLEYWDKQGRAIWGPKPLDGFFASAGNNAFSFDPRAMYDRQSGRFYVLLVEEDDATQKSFFNLAVSKSSHPLTSTASDWYFYRINNTRTVGTKKYWGDYPGLGFDGQAIYVTLNMYSFAGNNGDAQISILPKASFLNGSTNNYGFMYTGGGPAGGFTLQPCTVTGSSSPSNVFYFAETPVSGNFSTSVRIWALQNPVGARSLKSTSVTVPNNGGYPPFTGAPQPGTTTTIDTLDGRTQGNAAWYNDAVWFCTTAGGSSGKSKVYYYKIILNAYPTGTPTVGESGFIDGGPGEWTYQPSIGVNSRGDAALVYCQSSASRYPTIFAAVHSSIAATFDTPVLVKASPSYYSGGRWGDYGSVTADPVDDSFWVTHEWTKNRDWSTWWAQIGAPSSKPDGILELAFTPPNGSTLLAGSTEKIFAQVTDGLAVTNATVIATVNGGTNLVFRNNGVTPDVTAIDSIYSANLGVPNATNDLSLSFVITAPGKTNSTNIVTYSVLPVPVNDYFTNAIKVPPGGALYVSNNRFATIETAETNYPGMASIAGSLWWSWSPATTTNVLLDTTGSSVDTVLAVYQGTSISSLTQIVATNDVGTKKQAFLHFQATGGASYRIAVASVSTNSTGSLRLLVAPGGSEDTNSPTVTVVSPLNGQWVSNFLVTVTGTANDPQPNASGLTRVLLSVNGQLPVTAVGTTSWSSTFGLSQGLNSISVTAQDLAGNVSDPAIIDVTYVIVNPANDLFANAIPLTGVSNVVSAITTNATKEFGEPNHAGNNGGRSVWWNFTPAADGILNLTTTNSSFDTLLGVYMGNLVGDLTLLAGNDDAYPGALNGFSALSTAVHSNQVYHIAVDGFDGVSGTVFLGYTFTPANVYQVTINSTLGGSTVPGSQDVGSNSTIVITASPDPFFEFTGWTGSFAASANPLSIVVTSNINLTATFQMTGFTDDFETGGLHKLNWITTGDQPWLVQTDIALAGRFAARSGAIGNGQSSSLMFTTNFPGGTASFYLKVSSELGWDSLSFYLDGVMQDQWSGEVDWTSFSLPVPAGLHTLEWRYAKDATDSAGLDAAFIDNVNLPLLPELGPPVPALLTINRQPDGSLIVQVLGRTNQQYVIQSATSLTPPIVWQNLSTNIATGGVINFPVSGADQLRFYRTVVPLP